MPDRTDPLRDRLLGRVSPPEEPARYRERMEAMVEQDRQRIRRERFFITGFWIFCAISATVRLWFSADAARLPREPFLACIFFTWGGVELVKHHIHASRVDLLKEIKQLQVQVFELEHSLRKGDPKAEG